MGAVAFFVLAAFVPATASAQDLGPQAIVQKGSEKRPYGEYANYYADLAYEQSASAYSTYASDNAYYAYVYAYYGSAYGAQAGHRVAWNYNKLLRIGMKKNEAYRNYYDLRYQQASCDYYAYYYGYLAYSESGQTGWYDASIDAYYAYYYASVDLSY